MGHSLAPTPRVALDAAPLPSRPQLITSQPARPASQPDPLPSTFTACLLAIPTLPSLGLANCAATCGAGEETHYLKQGFLPPPRGFGSLGGGCQSRGLVGIPTPRGPGMPRPPPPLPPPPSRPRPALPSPVHTSAGRRPPGWSASPLPARPAPRPSARTPRVCGAAAPAPLCSSTPPGPPPPPPPPPRPPHRRPPRTPGQPGRVGCRRPGGPWGVGGVRCRRRRQQRWCCRGGERR